MGEKTVERAREFHRRADIAVERIFSKKKLSKKGRDFSTQTVVRSIHWEVNP